ncbi:hypothetical protein M409DRAFT_28104 [Zasmidium cellare ATCC 36951]|uniref:L-dopachrome isomerase n=1 Tax=Zasmidium cellare ATCC 36951 TaxID=1080233 RepID=A0A6A6C6I8_ZASCE|nr:uncharacterized protein M409DRAFT_28104 [Zasmidium cellare ATCC 36951]KAF2161369.1 hypothetical protein M409DRAFT_28104 [Zasmidium cellare ATCC 36951]
MPHSTKGSGDSHSTYSFDLQRPMNNKLSTTAPAPATFHSNNNKPQVPTHGKRDSTQSIQSFQSVNFNGNRGSLVAANAYASLIGKNDIDEFLQKHLGDRNTMIANYNNSAKQRTQYYEEQFQYKENVNSNVRERVQRESPVIAELRTNVIIKDEFTLVTDLSYHLAARYTRPDSSIMIKVDHSACLALGGTFDPCYILSISTVPSQMGPTMNKRNAALIQSFMADILSVPPERGIVKFQPIPEENFAINGTTMLGEIERQEKQQSGENTGAVRRAISNGRKSIPSFKKSVSKLDSEPKIVESKVMETTVEEPKLEEPKRPESKEKEKSDKAPVEARKSITPIAPTAILSPMGVFELPAVEVDNTRPSTSHGHSGSSSSNGLRMNGVSDKDLSPPSATKPRRPRTFSAGTTSIQDQIKSQGLTTAPINPPARLSSVPPSKRDRPPSFLKIDPSKSSTKSRHSKNASPQPPVDDNKPRPRDSYLDGIMGTPLQLKPFGTEPTILEKPSKEVLTEMTTKEKDEPTANTAKRRSTITAVPKIPEIPMSSPQEISDTKSTKSLKVGKRKSFLSAFRKSSGTKS